MPQLAKAVTMDFTNSRHGYPGRGRRGPGSLRLNGQLRAARGQIEKSFATASREEIGGCCLRDATRRQFVDIGFTGASCSLAN